MTATTHAIDVYMAVVLVPLYLIAAGLRWHAARRNAALRRWYLASIPLCVAVAAVYVWAALDLNQALRGTVARALSFPSAVLVWIWPAVYAARSEE